MKRQFLAILLGLTLLMPSMLFAAGAIQLPQTGQTICYDDDDSVIACFDTGQDGGEQAGVVWPDPRFNENLDGMVSDNLAGLIRLANANCFNGQLWSTALSSANTLASGPVASMTALSPEIGRCLTSPNWQAWSITKAFIQPFRKTTPLSSRTSLRTT